MPIYEYRCPVCGKETEELAKFDDPDPSCPAGCTLTSDPPQPVVMRKKVSRSSFELLGGGWEKDGYGG